MFVLKEGLQRDRLTFLLFYFIFFLLLFFVFAPPRNSVCDHLCMVDER